MPSVAAEAVEIRPDLLPRTGEIDARFQSYNVEMAEITGGEFWRPYDAADLASPAGGKGGDDRGRHLFQSYPPLDTANARLRTLAAALGPAYVRISGTWANSIYVNDRDTQPPREPPAGFKAVLTRSQWRGALGFVRAADAALVVSFAVSAGVRDRNGIWTADQAVRWLEDTRAAGSTIAAAEFFNEPTLPGLAGVPDGYDAAAYARDFAIFRAMARRLAPDMAIAGPGAVGEASAARGDGMISTEDILGADPKPVFDIYSYHHYPALSLRCASMGKQTQTTADAALSEDWLGRAGLSAQYHLGLRDRFAPGAPVWVTEIADAACGGNRWAKSFLDSFRYLDVLGRLARAGVSVVFHNTLAASDYGLLEPATFAPRPNYWSALLWRRLMGTTVLDAGPVREGLHLYAHCQRGVRGGVVLLAINNSRTDESEIRLGASSTRYTLSAPSLQSERIALNGSPLQLGPNDDLPPLQGVAQAPGEVRFGPATITFLAISSAGNPRCG